MNYKKIYTDLINKRVNEPFSGDYSENHHIFPKSLGGNDDVENLVCLSAREHYIAHALLVKIHVDDNDKYLKMLWAFNGMRHLQRDYQERIVGNSHLYESLKGKYKHSEETRQKMSESAKGHIVTEETRNKLSETRKKLHKEGKLPSTKGKNNGMYGKTHSDEVKRKLSELNKGKKLNLSEEELIERSNRMKGEKNPMYGKTHSDEVKRKLSELHKGRKDTPERTEQRRRSSSNKIHINNGIEGKFVTEDDFNSIWKLKGWKLGMKPRRKKS